MHVLRVEAEKDFIELRAWLLSQAGEGDRPKNALDAAEWIGDILEVSRVYPFTVPLPPIMIESIGCAIANSTALLGRHDRQFATELRDVP